MGKIASKSLLLIFLVFLAISCSEKKDDKKIRVKANYTRINDFNKRPARYSHEINYQDGKIIKDISTTKIQGMEMLVIKEFDRNENLIILDSRRNGSRAVLQVNSYTADSLLLSELRLEGDVNSPDTFLFEYHYPNERPNPMHYYRTNNGVRVTNMILTKSKNMEIFEECAHSSTNYVNCTTIKNLKNDKGQIVERQQFNAVSNQNDESIIDTVKQESVFFEYNADGRVVKSTSKELNGGNVITESFYKAQGVLHKVLIKRSGFLTESIKYKEF